MTHRLAARITGLLHRAWLPWPCPAPVLESAHTGRWTLRVHPLAVQSRGLARPSLALGGLASDRQLGSQDDVAQRRLQGAHTSRLTRVHGHSSVLLSLCPFWMPHCQKFDAHGPCVTKAQVPSWACVQYYLKTRSPGRVGQNIVILHSGRPLRHLTCVWAAGGDRGCTACRCGGNCPEELQGDSNPPSGKPTVSERTAVPKPPQRRTHGGSLVFHLVSKPTLSRVEVVTGPLLLQGLRTA